MGRRLIRVLYAWIPSSLREFVSLHFTRSRLGKRIVLLLLICGLVPPILFSFPLYYQTYDVRREDAIESLQSYATISRRRSFPLNWLSINVSGQQLTQEGLLDLASDLQASFGITPGALKLEVTETSLIEETQRALETLKTLRERGFSICLDDFGTGYSSLSLVHTFPLDILKIDLHFVRDIHLDSHNQAIVRGIMSMARQLDLKVVAEGIETREELDYLLEVIGCDFGQGYLFARPLDAGELLDRLGKPRPFGSDELPALNAPS